MSSLCCGKKEGEATSMCARTRGIEETKKGRLGLTGSSAACQKLRRRAPTPASNPSRLGERERGEREWNERGVRGEEDEGVVKARGAVMAA